MHLNIKGGGYVCTRLESAEEEIYDERIKPQSLGRKMETVCATTDEASTDYIS